mmetsp:Transcript_4738/g.13371  ORF Transcript_4738/g.13371 Transcript_4738/m.13371 type:complete len:256 (+) Transcript_4738:1984-2751(+)
MTQPQTQYTIQESGQSGLLLLQKQHRRIQAAIVQPHVTQYVKAQSVLSTAGHLGVETRFHLLFVGRIRVLSRVHRRFAGGVQSQDGRQRTIVTHCVLPAGPKPPSVPRIPKYSMERLKRIQIGRRLSIRLRPSVGCLTEAVHQFHGLIDALEYGNVVGRIQFGNVDAGGMIVGFAFAYGLTEAPQRVTSVGIVNVVRSQSQLLGRAGRTTIALGEGSEGLETSSDGRCESCLSSHGRYEEFVYGTAALIAPMSPS